MVIDLKQIPFLRFLVPFILGILAAIYAPFSLNKTHIIAVIIVLLPVCLLIYQSKNSLKYNFILGMLVSLLFFSLGWLLCTSRQMSYNYSNIKEKTVYYGSVSSMPLKARTTTKVELLLKKYIVEDSIYPLNEKIISYLRDTAEAMRLKTGDKIILKTTLQTVRAPKNPGEFNYKKYLNNHYIKHTCFVSEGQWKLVTEGSSYNIFRLAGEAQLYLISLLRKCNMSHSELGVTEAILTGYKAGLPDEVRQSYSSTGVMHVLAVSGLHTGIIYLLFSFLLKAFDKKRQLRILKAIFIISALWCFAFITGLPSSVMRAATMFSFIALGKAIDRKSNIYNTIALSAFILLCVDPMNIMDVGFQLSYLALLGIISFFPILYHLWFTKYYLLDKIWALICISIAAQLATFPLCIYYFHQFPNLFIITNLPVIPLVTIILYAGVAYFFLHAIPLLGIGLGYLLKYLAFALNKVVFTIEQIPYSLSQGLNFDFYQVLLLYVILIMILCFVYFEKKNYLFASLGLFALFLGIKYTDVYENNQLHRLYIYQIKGHTALNILNSSQNILIADSSLLKDSSTLAYTIYPNHNMHHSAELKSIPLSKLKNYSNKTNFISKNGILAVNDLKFVVANEMFSCCPNDKVKGKLKIDFLLLTDNYPLKQVKELLNFYQPELILLDGSDYRWYKKKIRALLKSKRLTIYDTAKEGAYFIDIL